MVLLPNLPSGDYDIQPSTSDDSSLRQLHQMSSIDKEEMLRLMQSQSSKSVNTEKSEMIVRDEQHVSPPAVVTTPKNKSSTIITTTAAAAAATTTESSTMNKNIPNDGIDNDCGGTAETQEITRSDDGNSSAQKKDVVADVADSNTNNINNKQRGESPGELHTATSNLSHTSSLSASPTSEDHPALVVNNDAVSDDDVVLSPRNTNDHHLEDGYAPPPPHGLVPYHRGPGTSSGAMMMPPYPPPPPHSHHHHPHHLHPNPHSPYHHHHHHHHPSHPYYRSHQQRPVLPPPHLQLYHHPEDAIDEVPEGGDNDPSPSASTISTKASLAVVKGTTQLERCRTKTSYPPPTPTRVSYHKNKNSNNNELSNNNDRSTSATTTRRQLQSSEKEVEVGEEDRRRTSSGSHSPSPHRMMYAHQLLSLSSDNNTESSQQKPKRPVYDKKLLRSEGVAGNATTSTTNTIHEEKVVEQQKEVGQSNYKPNHPEEGRSPIPPGLDGRLLTTTMAESPTVASAGGVSSQSQQSHQSLELGAMPSWETAGKPLGGWSVCSGNTFGGMESLKDGVFSSAFSFSESSLPNTKKKVGDSSFGGCGLEKDDDDPSPKSILSKSGEKRKIAPGTHVQFTRDHHHHHHGDTGVGLEISTSMGAEPRKRMRPSSVHHPGAYPPPPHPLHDEYYYGDNPPRHAMYPPYDHYGGGSRHPPPPHPSSRHPHSHDQGHYMDDDPYYDQYYGPPPYGYPPHSRHPPSSSSNRHPHPRAEYGPPHHPPPGGPGRGGGGRGGTNIYTVHTPPTSSYRGPHHHHLTPMNTQYSHIRSIPSAIGGMSASSWSKDDDNALMDLMRKIKSPKSWDPIAKKFERGKSAREIHDRWTRYLKPGSRKGQWTDEEDQVVVETVQNSMEDPFTRWSDLAQRLPGRVGKQVRDRWVNHLNPAINHLPFSREDDLLLWNGHNVAGKRWVEISSKYFKGTRSENHIKNRWYSASFKKFIAKEFGPDSYRLANDGVPPTEAQSETHPSMPVVQQSSRHRSP
jgi:hypothetical protein